MALSAIAINCTLKRSGGEPSSTDKMIDLIAGEFAQARRRNSAKRSASPIMTSSPASPRTKATATPGPTSASASSTADILIFGTPIWLGQTSSIAKRVVERMDAFLSETDERGRMPSFGKVAVVGDRRQ